MYDRQQRHGLSREHKLRRGRWWDGLATARHYIQLTASNTLPVLASYISMRAVHSASKVWIRSAWQAHTQRTQPTCKHLKICCSISNNNQCTTLYLPFRQSPPLSLCAPHTALAAPNPARGPQPPQSKRPTNQHTQTPSSDQANITP